MEKYKVTGMSCAACSARVEQAVSKVPGVTSCFVSLLTNTLGVEGSAGAEEIIRAVEAAGYGVSKKPVEQGVEKPGEQGEETKEMKKRLSASLLFLIVLMYISMGHMMWGFPLPAAWEENAVALGLGQLLLTIAVMIVNRNFFLSGWKGLCHKAPNMDTLVALGSGAAFAYSTYALFAMTGEQLRGNAAGVMHYMHELYFESAAMILTLITVGKMLEAHSKGKTTDALKGLMKLAPKTATVLREGVEIRVAVEQVKQGDCFTVRPGEQIPVDGVVLEGSSAVNEAALTGESIPVDKEPGSMVSAATINQSGYLKCEATRVGEDTTLSQIIRMVSDASATKAPIAKIADKVSGVFVPAVILIAAVTILVWLLLGESVGFALARGISVLVISCPCALGLATPVAIMVGSGVGARNGILFKTATALEEVGKTEIAVLDKTGTITSGKPVVTSVKAAEGIRQEELLAVAYLLEQRSEHPLAQAITGYVAEGIRREGQEEHKLLPGIGACLEGREITEFKVVPGNGVSARIDGMEYYGGSLSYLEGKAEIPEAERAQAGDWAEEGNTPVCFIKEGKLLGMMAIADTIREDSPRAIEELKNMGIRVVMLTGDNERTARAVGRRAGVDEVIAGVLPDGKEAAIRSFRKKGRVLMVGDGINDAPALTGAEVGIAIGAGADIAMDAADIVLMKSSLSDVPAAIRLGRATLRNIKENLFWAFLYNTIGIPLAAGVFISGLGLRLNPMFGAAAMSLSSFCVVTNALRLNLVRVHDTRRDRKMRKEEIKQMKKTMKIEGMMCGHCEARVKKCLEEVPGVAQAEVSHATGTAELTLMAETSDESLRSAVEAQGYQVISIQ